VVSFPTEALELLRTGIPGLQALWLFGSRAGEECRPDSDWDLAFLAGLRLDSWTCLDLRARLSVATGAEVDLVDLRTASTVLAIEVLRADRLLLDLDPFVRESFEMRTLTRYQDLNEARKGILEDLGMAA
jgi:predicted nucleotidyltransferase